MNTNGSDTMNISIGNLMITSFCSSNAEHIKFKHNLKQDDLIYEFVSTTIEDDLKEVQTNSLQLEQSYIIQDQDKLVGYICIKDLIEEHKTVELRYAVHQEFRKLGYGRKILEECKNYLFTLDDIDSIELHIRKDNYPSINCAEKAKYKRIGENNEEYYYIYRCYK